MDRFELLELIYDMRKANLELTERLEAAEKKIEELKTEADQRVADVRSEYTQLLDDLRMQGAAKELQKRMNEIEEQLIMFQRITGKDASSGKGEDTGRRDSMDLAGVFSQPVREALEARPESAASSQGNGSVSATQDDEAGESRD